MQRIYVGAQFDVPGVVAANTFLAFYMPSTSPKFAVALNVSCIPYANGASSVTNSMTIRRITAASGGTLVAASTIPRFTRTDEDPSLQMLIGNPTVTASARIPLVGYPPPMSTGTGTGAGVTQQSPGGASFDILPGYGLAFQTAAGNVNQLWNLQFIWQEFYLPPAS